mmetsp:Transcript_53274/g.102976  ORF Transcript_53274/g.102976 Transcript_53274/m.102976 type:complete len:490 (+) Transcript_53274:87-1556(+)
MQLAAVVCCTVIAGCVAATARVTGNRRQQLRSLNPDLEVDGGNPPATEPAIDFGSLTCMRWTGGTCLFSACKSERGPTTCVSGKCMCQPGSCADAEGTCIHDFKGEWIGEYAIHFMDPALPHRPYLGLGSQGMMSGPPGMIAGLGTTDLNTKQWKLALTPNGRVRFQSKAYPDSVLTIYNNRRRSFLQTIEQRLTSKVRQRTYEQMANSSSGSSSGNAHDHAKKGHAMFGSYDLWPSLVKLEKAGPHEATFQVRPTMQDGGGLEIWDPHTKVALANTNAEESWTADAFDADGIGECVSPESGDCEGRQLVEFEPPLPAKARETAVRAMINKISILYMWQTVMIVLCGICVCCLSQWLENGGAESLSRGNQAAPVAPVSPPPRPTASGQWTLTSELGSFEYEFNARDDGATEPVSVRGKAADGTWDQAVDGTWELEAARWWRPGGPRWVLRFQGPDGTNFEIEFCNSDTLKGTAKSSTVSMSFTGNRNNA